MNGQEKKTLILPAAVSFLSCLLAGFVIILLPTEKHLPSLAVIASFCLWLAVIAAAHLTASIQSNSLEARKKNTTGQEVLDPTSRNMIQNNLHKSDATQSLIFVVLTLGTLLVAAVLYVFQIISWRPQWNLSWEATLGTVALTLLVLNFSMNYNNGQSSLWSACLRICSGGSLFALIAAFAYVWLSRVFDVSEPDWLAGASTICLCLVVVDSLVSELLRLMQEPDKRYENWGPGSGVWMTLFLRDHEATLLNDYHKKSPMQQETSRLLVSSELRHYFLTVLLAGTFLFWLSTSLTTIPTGHMGVALNLGKVSPKTQPPGLHTHLPWPFAQIISVDVSKVIDLLVGHEADSKLPLLWDEKNQANQILTLCSSGEELIEASISVFFRVRDAKAFYLAGNHTREILKALILNVWTKEALSYDVSELNSTNRLKCFKTMSQSVQEKADRLGLGIDVLFLAINSLHPPHQTARAFQDVTNAKELILTETLNAEADAALLLAEAAAEAATKINTAEAEKMRSISAAYSISVPFESILMDSHDFLGATRAIKQFNALEKSLAGRPLAIISSTLQQVLDFSIDSRAQDNRTTQSARSDSPKESPQDFHDYIPKDTQNQIISIDPLPRAEPDWNANPAPDNKLRPAAKK